MFSCGCCKDDGGTRWSLVVRLCARCVAYVSRHRRRSTEALRRLRQVLLERSLSETEARRTHASLARRFDMPKHLNMVLWIRSIVPHALFIQELCVLKWTSLEILLVLATLIVKFLNKMFYSIDCYFKLPVFYSVDGKCTITDFMNFTWQEKEGISGDGRKVWISNENPV